MACFNLQIGNKTYVFNNNDSSLGEDKDSPQGWDSFISFLTSGNLDYNGYIQDEYGNKLTVEAFFDAVENELKECKDPSYLQIHTSKPNIPASGKWFIDNLVGNKTFGDYGQNVFSNKNWGHNVWYGFSSRRGVIIGGYFNTQHASLLFKLYEEVKKEVSQGIKDSSLQNLINSLYLESNPDKDSNDLFAKLTWVANMRLDKLLITLDMKYTDNFYFKKNIRSLRSEIRRSGDTEAFKNMYIISNGEPYIIVGKVSQTNDTIGVTDLSGKEMSIEVNSITKIGKTRRLVYGGTQYFKINNDWYKLDKSQSKESYIKIKNAADKKNLNEVFLGLSGMKILDWRRVKKEDSLFLQNVFGNGKSKKKLKTFEEFSKLEGVVLQTNLGIYTSNGENFITVNGDILNVGSNPRIEMIYFPQEIIENTEQEFLNNLLVKLEPPVEEKVFSFTDVRIGLCELCGIEDHTKIWKAYNMNTPTQIIQTETGLALKINSKHEVKYNDKFISEVLFAGKFLKFAEEHYSELSTLMGTDAFEDDLEDDDTEVNKKSLTFNRIFTLLKRGKLMTEFPKIYSYISDNFKDLEGNPVIFSFGASEELQKVVDDNDALAISSKMGNVQLDSIIDSLIKKGMYIYSCEI